MIEKKEQFIGLNLTNAAKKCNLSISKFKKLFFETHNIHFDDFRKANKLPSEPKKTKIDWDLVDKGLECGSTTTSIANKLGVHHITLQRRCEIEKEMSWKQYKQLKKTKGNDTLREKMYEVAMNGNVTMLIWLSKNWLGFSDKVTQEEKDVTVKFVYNEK